MLVIVLATTVRTIGYPIDFHADPGCNVSMNTYCWAQSKFYLQPNYMNQTLRLNEPIDYSQRIYFQVWFTLQVSTVYIICGCSLPMVR